MTPIRFFLPTAKAGGIQNLGFDDKNKKEECQTCATRKYQDGSDEMVSFKTAQHMSPESAASRVRAHEQEHVTNAYDEAMQKDGQVVACSVQIKTSICPECGRSYVAGGLTTTQIKYPNEENPYWKNVKALDEDFYKGSSIDLKAG